jgi:uncharacterized protein (DUF1800 family)
MSIDPNLGASIAVTRFGLGARPGEIDAARADPKGYLKAQIRLSGADQPVGAFQSSAAHFVAVREYQMQRRQDLKAGIDPVKEAQKQIRATAIPEFLGRAQLACNTDASFRERWTLFWCNHFTVASKNLQTAVLVGPFEREAIRPHVFGRFEDLLTASTMHPAMLLYLDQAQSIGPHSPVMFMAGPGVGRFRQSGLNENLAREILELHTLGVGSGYTQADVTEFARALTGWSIQGPDAGQYGGRFASAGAPGQFTFREVFHEPGARHLFGKSYNQDGISQAGVVLHDIAGSPATAHHLAVKIARHFVADDPPPALVARLERAYLQSDGRLDQVADALIDAPEAWSPQQAKFKTPYEFLVSSYRAVGAAPEDFTKFGPVLTGLGQQPFNAPSPKGWAEEAEAWAAPDAIVRRMSWSEAFAQAAAPVNLQPTTIADASLGARLTPPVAQAVAHAESRPEGLAILLMSPEFQRR